MRLAVLGATGPSGQALVQQALEAGHEVVALVRNPEKLKISHDNLKIEKGSIFSEDFLTSHFNGCDVVMSCLGAPVSFWNPITLLYDSCKIIIQAMRKTDVKKFIVMSAICSKDDPRASFMLRWIFIPLIIGRNLTDMAHMEDFLLEECQDIDFIVVKPPGLTNEALDSRTVLAEEGQIGSGVNRVSRAHVAHFMLGQLTDDQWHKKLVALSMAK